MLSRNRVIVLASLAIIILVSLSVHSGPREDASWLEKSLFETVSTFQKGLTSSARGLENLWRAYFYLAGLREENRELRRAVESLKGQVAELREKGEANKRFTKLLNFSENHQYNYCGAHVVAWNPGPWIKTITIDRGSSDGVGKDMPVVSDVGVVGRVIEVSPNYSKVLLLTDFNSSIDALVQRSRARGIVTGHSEKKCTLNYVRQNDEVAKGDIVVTSGLGGVFPKGIPLGTVSRIKSAGHDIFLEVDITPEVRLNRLEEVLVILTEQPPF